MKSTQPHNVVLIGDVDNKKMKLKNLQRTSLVCKANTGVDDHHASKVLIAIQACRCYSIDVDTHRLSRGVPSSVTPTLAFVLDVSDALLSDVRGRCLMEASSRDILS